MNEWRILWILLWSEKRPIKSIIKSTIHKFLSLGSWLVPAWVLPPWSVMSGPLSSLPSLSIINSGHRMGSEWKERTRPDHGWWWQAKEGPAPRRSRLIPPHVILASFAAQRAEPFGRGEECNVGERRQTETKGEGPVAARKGEDDNKRAEIDDGRLKDSSPHSSLRSSPVVSLVILALPLRLPFVTLVPRSFLTVACGSGVCEERRDEPIETETGEQRNRGTGWTGECRTDKDIIS